MLLSGCGGGGTGPDDLVASITLTPSSIDTLFSFGDTVRISASPRDASGALVPGATSAFESSSASVAAVSETGLVTASGNGVTTVTATSGGASASLTVRVRQRLAVLIVPGAAVVAVARTTALGATPADARGGVILGLAPTFASGDDRVATVNANGVVTGVAVGSTTIRSSVVSLADGSLGGTTSITVTAAPPLSATVSLGPNRFLPDTVSISVNGTVTFVNVSGTTHDVDFGTPAMKIPPFDSGERSMVFPTAGTLNYHCNIHIGMEAVVVVQ
jgi:plastocyanin